MLYVVSTLVLCLLGAGLYFRRRRPHWHFKIMLGAFAIDLLLVLYIEFTRQAVETVVTERRLWLLIHAGISLGVLACYAGMIALGWQLLAGKPARASRHRNLGMLFCFLRGANYLTSFIV